MININSQAQLQKLFGNIEKQIGVALNESAFKIAEKVQKEAQTLVETRSENSSGRLSGAIKVKPGSGNTFGYYRYDVIVDTSTAPYALWVEFGRSATVGLPYSNAGGKDYSKSKFQGHRYMRDALVAIAQKSKIEPIIANEIRISMSKLTVK